MSHRLYNEKEIASILQRASVLSPNASDETRVGLTLDELRQIGLESGLDPDAVAAAAAELEAGSTAMLPPGIFGGPLTHTSTVVIDHELTDEEWEDMLVAIRRTFGNPGLVQTRAHVYEWVIPESRKSQSGHVSATVRNGKTKIQVFWSDPTSAIPFYIPTFMGMTISLPILFDELSMGVMGIPVWIALVASLFMLSRFGVGIRGRMGVQKVERLAEELREMGRNHTVRAQASTEEVPVSTGSIGIDEEAAPTGEANPSRTRIR